MRASRPRQAAGSCCSASCAAVAPHLTTIGNIKLTSTLQKKGLRSGQTILILMGCSGGGGMRGGWAVEILLWSIHVDIERRREGGREAGYGQMEREKEG